MESRVGGGDGDGGGERSRAESSGVERRRAEYQTCRAVPHYYVGSAHRVAWQKLRALLRDRGVRRFASLAGKVRRFGEVIVRSVRVVLAPAAPLCL